MRAHAIAAFVLPGLLGFALSAPADTGPRRIVSLAPSLTELVFDLGLEAHMVGRSSACDHPPEAQTIPVAGGFGRPNLERVQGLRADLVVATDLERPGLLRALQGAGVEGLVLPCESWEQLMMAATDIADALGEPETGRVWRDEMEARRRQLEARVNAFYESRERPRIYVEVWGRPPTTAGRDTFLHEVVTLAGGVNIAGELQGRYKYVSSEWVIREDPDVILLAYMLAEQKPREALRERLGWASMRAVRTGGICDEIPADWLLRPGPRLIRGAEALAEYLMSVSGEAEGP